MERRLAAMKNELAWLEMQSDASEGLDTWNHSDKYSDTCDHRWRAKVAETERHGETDYRELDNRDGQTEAVEVQYGSDSAFDRHCRDIRDEFYSIWRGMMDARKGQGSMGELVYFTDEGQGHKVNEELNSESSDGLGACTRVGQGSLMEEGLMFCLDGEQRFRMEGRLTYECDEELAASTDEASVERPTSAARPTRTGEKLVTPGGKGKQHPFDPGKSVNFGHVGDLCERTSPVGVSKEQCVLTCGVTACWTTARPLAFSPRPSLASPALPSSSPPSPRLPLPRLRLPSPPRSLAR